MFEFRTGKCFNNDRTFTKILFVVHFIENLILCLDKLQQLENS